MCSQGYHIIFGTVDVRVVVEEVGAAGPTEKMGAGAMLKMGAGAMLKSRKGGGRAANSFSTLSFLLDMFRILSALT